MAKYFDPSDETVKLVSEVMNSTDLIRYISVKIIVNDEQKKEPVKVKKLAPDVKFMIGDDIQLTINEAVLDQLPENLQLMCIEEVLTGVHFDPETERLTINKPDFTTYSGMLDKYEFALCKTLKESIKSLYDTKKNDDSQENAE